MLTVYQRIMRAAARGTGVRLSADEVLKLSLDHSVFEAAGCDDSPEDVIPSNARIGDHLEQPRLPESGGR